MRNESFKNIVANPDQYKAIVGGDEMRVNFYDKTTNEEISLDGEGGFCFDGEYVIDVIEGFLQELGITFLEI